jgi:hypothetical protein
LTAFGNPGIQLAKPPQICKIHEMSSFIPQPSESQIDAEIAIMREHSKMLRQSNELAIAFLIRAGIFTKSGKPKKRFDGGKLSVEK